MYHRTENCAFEREHIKELSESYFRTAEELSEHRDELIKRRSGTFLAPDEIRSLNDRIDILHAEICELRATATHLRRLAAPPAETPSLSRRERRLS